MADIPICSAMFGNGAPTGDAATLPSLLQILLALWRAPRACCAAAPGTTSPGTSGRRTATVRSRLQVQRRRVPLLRLSLVVGQVREGEPGLGSRAGGAAATHAASAARLFDFIAAAKPGRHPGKARRSQRHPGKRFGAFRGPSQSSHTSRDRFRMPPRAVPE